MKTALKWAVVALLAHTVIAPLLLVVGVRAEDGAGYYMLRAQRVIDAPVQPLVWHTSTWLGPAQVRAAEATDNGITDVTVPLAIVLYSFYGGAFYFVLVFLLALGLLRMARGGSGRLNAQRALR
jgi:hypothetical protein